MTPREIAIVACRIFVLYVILQLLYWSQTVLGSLSILVHNPNTYNALLLVWSCITFLLILAFAVFLWVKADKIADKLLPRAKSNESIIFLHYEALHNIAFSVLGMVILIYSIPDFIRDMIGIFSIHGIFFDSVDLTSVIISLIEIIFGIILCFFPQKITKFIKLADNLSENEEDIEIH